MADGSWLIEGWDGDEPILSLEIDSRRIGRQQVQRLLTALAAKHGRLTDDELISCFLKRNYRRGDRDGDPHLHVHWDAAARAFLCGLSVHFSARLVNTDGAPGVRLRKSGRKTRSSKTA